ncbi:MAG: DnaA ATPase domain-containing protein [Thermoguttaceae bacterium]
MTVASPPTESLEAAFLSALAAEVGPTRLRAWTGAGVEIRVNAGTVTVSTTGVSLLDWMRVNFRDPICAASRAAFGRELPIRFEVVPVQSERVATGVCKVTWGGPDAAASLPAAEAAVEVVHAAHVASPPHKPQAVGAVASAPESAAKPRSVMTFDNFVVGMSNRMARTVLDHVVAEPGTMTPLYLYGGSSVGKTHLLEATWRAVHRRPKSKPPILMTSEQFTTHFIGALRQSGVPNFRAKFRGVSMVLIDDIPFLAGKRETQVELLNMFDTLLAQGVQIVVTGDRPLSALTMLRPEIVARLSSGMPCEIKPPDASMLLTIAQQMARQRGLDVADDVCRYLAASVGGDARRLSGALHRLHAVTLVAPQSITLSVAQETLHDIAGESGVVTPAPSPLGLAEIEAVVCEEFGLSPSDLRSASRSRSVAQPRMVAMWLARQHTRFALSEIGTFFGNRSHSTVLAAHKRVAEWLESENEVTATVTKLERLLTVSSQRVSSQRRK